MRSRSGRRSARGWEPGGDVAGRPPDERHQWARCRVTIIRLPPVARMSSVSSFSAAFLRRSIRSKAAMSAAAIRRWVLPAASCRRTLTSSGLAWAVER